MKNIGVLGAMEIEIEQLKKKYEGKYEKEEVANFIFYKVVEEEDKKIIFGYSKVGKVFSTIAATIMIEKFKIDCLLFTGIAGSLNEDYDILDTVLVTKTCQHDIDITAFGHPKGYISESEVFLETPEELIRVAEEVSLTDGLKIQYGVVATGDQFLSSPEEKRKVKEEFKADMIEMEGGSVAVVATQYKIPYLIVRTISDSATGDALIEFNEMQEKAAKKNSNLVELIIENILK